MSVSTPPPPQSKGIKFFIRHQRFDFVPKKNQLKYVTELFQICLFKMWRFDIKYGVLLNKNTTFELNKKHWGLKQTENMI